MGVFSRMGDIINSNINAMLDKAEDPEKMIRLMIQEMEDTLVDLKSSCASKMATKAEMQREKETLEAKSKRWDERATLAVERDRDDLAKEALLEKKNCQKQLDYAEIDLENYTQLISDCKSNIVQLEQKLEEVSLKHKMLIQRGIHAKEKQRARTMMSHASGNDAMMRFSELENRIERMEADADLSGRVEDNDLEREFSRLESDNAVEAELAALKKSVKGSAKPQKKEESNA
ncbi:MAG: PspA/IM30 family protein [Spirochaetales bacterium]|nr:PspA/IM30 family protein [Spirochaetales bacterium]